VKPYEIVSDGFDNVATNIEFHGTISGNSFTATNDVNGLKISNLSSLGGLTIGADGAYINQYSSSSPYKGSRVSFEANNDFLINGPINIYGYGVDIRSNIGSSNTTSGDILIKASTQGLLNSSGTPTLTVPNGRTLTVNQSGNSTFSGLIAGSGSLTKSGTGTLTLSGASTYSGGTTVSDGTLKAGAASSGTIGSATSGPFGTGSVTINASKTLDVDSNLIHNTKVNNGSIINKPNPQLLMEVLL
jgi:fibronectin-binding autotransporter adhesin